MRVGFEGTAGLVRAVVLRGSRSPASWLGLLGLVACWPLLAAASPLSITSPTHSLSDTYFDIAFLARLAGATWATALLATLTPFLRAWSPLRSAVGLALAVAILSALTGLVPWATALLAPPGGAPTTGWGISILESLHLGAMAAIFLRATGLPPGWRAGGFFLAAWPVPGALGWTGLLALTPVGTHLAAAASPEGIAGWDAILSILASLGAAALLPAGRARTS